MPFKIGKFNINGQTAEIAVDNPTEIKKGLYADLDKIPATATIRTKRTGDVFTKFGGGTKKLSDYLTDKKIPLTKRSSLLLLADGNAVLAIFGVAISDKIKIDEKTKRTIKFIIQRN